MSQVHDSAVDSASQDTRPVELASELADEALNVSGMSVMDLGSAADATRRVPRTRLRATEPEQRVMEAAKLLGRVASPLRILRALEWPPEVGERFLAAGGTVMPKIRYPRRDYEPMLSAIKDARALVPGSTYAERWVRRQARTITLATKMLRAVGTPQFHDYSQRLYGSPRQTGVDGSTTSLDLAVRLDGLLSRLDQDDLGIPVERLSAPELARRMKQEISRFLGDMAPDVVLVKHLAAKAIAGIQQIQLDARAHFDEGDLRQLVAHEAMVHALTRINGQRQNRLPVLGVGHPGSTRTQEGLAVFSELITGSMTPRRFRRLANRVLAIDASMQGADFIEIYRFFLDKTDDPGQSFEDARRVFRGAVLEGGAPFTKDGVYLDGLVRVHNFLRAAVELRRPDLVPLLFVGRLDLDDIVALSRLRARGLVKPPRFLPPWAVDRRFLIAYLAYSGFLNQVVFPRVHAHYERLLAQADVTPSE